MNKIATSLEEKLIQKGIDDINSGNSDKIITALQLYGYPFVFQYAVDKVPVTKTLAWLTILRSAPKEILPKAISKYLCDSKGIKNDFIFNAVKNKNISKEDFNTLLDLVTTKKRAIYILENIPTDLSIEMAFLLAKKLIELNFGIDFTQGNSRSLTLSLAFIYFRASEEIEEINYEMLNINSKVIFWARSENVLEIIKFATFFKAGINKMKDGFVKETAENKLSILLDLPKVLLR